MPSALIVEDDRPTRFALSELIESEGFTTSSAETFDEARAELQRIRPDVVFLDVFLPDGSGLDLLLEIPADRRPHVLLMSGEESVRRVVQDMALRTVHFLRKPVEPQLMIELLDKVRRSCRTVRKAPERVGRMLGSSASMREVHELVAKVAPTNFPVYVEGESGTGKELVAESVHLASDRAEGPFVAINCGALPESLIDSELFGHERGAFTGATAAKKGLFEQANGGTLFLDEVTEMPPELQVRLLRVLETGRLRRVGGTRDIEVDVRIVAASNRPAATAIAEERLREDLFHRLSVFPIHLPPLRERGDDVASLADHFLQDVGEDENQLKSFSDCCLDALRRYSWPGNVRQLRNAVQRAYIVADGVVTAECLPPQILARTGIIPDATPKNAGDAVRVKIGTTIADAERLLIESTMARHDGDKRTAASALGISLRTLYNRLREYGGDYSAQTEESGSA